jgi:hypothetical protein
MGVPYEPDYPEEIELFDIETVIQKFVGEIEVESLDEESEEFRNVETAFFKENYDKIEEYVKNFVIHN